MYKDIITYRLAEGVSEEHLLAVATEVMETWMKHQPGFQKWEIHADKGGETYTDIVYWASEADAKNAEKTMAEIPNAGAWFACYAPGSISSRNVTLVGAFGE